MSQPDIGNIRDHIRCVAVEDLSGFIWRDVDDNAQEEQLYTDGKHGSVLLGQKERDQTSVKPRDCFR